MDDVMWTVESAVDVPLVVLAPDWRTALCMGLQLLELEERAAALTLARVDGGVLAHDPRDGTTLRVTFRQTIAPDIAAAA